MQKLDNIRQRLIRQNFREEGECETRVYREGEHIGTMHVFHNADNDTSLYVVVSGSFARTYCTAQSARRAIRGALKARFTVNGQRYIAKQTPEGVQVYTQAYPSPLARNPHHYVEIETPDLAEKVGARCALRMHEHQWPVPSPTSDARTFVAKADVTGFYAIPS